MNFTIEEIYPKIYLLKAESSDELASLFMRYQEFYENPVWKNKVFTIKEFTDWYIKEYGQMSYNTDWAGFNIPVERILTCIVQVKDMEPFDTLMGQIVAELPFDAYLIGVSVGHGYALNHETAHGFYYTNSRYKAEMDLLILNTDQDVINEVRKCIAAQMYHPSVIDDELQAYLSTGIIKEIIPITISSEIIESFEQVFNKYRGTDEVKI